MKLIATFSIVAFDPEEKACGIAVASKFPAVGAVVPWAEASSGAVATQSYANTTFGPRGLALMQEGASASDALDTLIQDDGERELRQVGMVDPTGGAASYTGEKCLNWAGGQTGEYFAAQGNILTGPETIDAMVEAFLKTAGSLPTRLFKSLLAGDRAGGDRRGRQSAAILVVKEKGGYGGYNDRWLDYRVDDHEDPVPRLGELIDLHELFFGQSPESDQVEIAGEVAEALQRIASTLGYYQGPTNGQYDSVTRDALRKFIGNENFEERTDFENGKIDQPVLEYLLSKFGG
jgi:uncharacterized Ntn-hydrolase superfamily protein